MILKFNVQAQAGNNHRSAVAVVTGTVDVLHANRRVNAAPQMQRVISFGDGLPPVVETSITQKKSVTAQRQIFLVISRNAVRSKSNSSAIEFSAPASAGCSRTHFHGAVHFGIGIRLVASFVPAPAPENTEPIVEWLFEVSAEPVFYGGTQRMRRYFRSGGQTCKVIIDGFAVASHVGVIHVGE